MSNRFKSLTLMLSLSVVLTCSAAYAAVREKSVCPSMDDFRNRESRFGGECYSGKGCTVGIRGAFLDLTDRATAVDGPPNASVRIMDKGVDDSRIGDCVPRSNSGREGFVSIHLTDITGTGPLRVRLSRPNLIGGRDNDTISVTVLNGGTYLARPGSSLGTDYGADRNVQKTIHLTGKNLGTLVLKNPVAGDELLTGTSTSRSVKLTFTTQGSVSLETRLEFAGRTPLPNVEGGWPNVFVRSGQAAAAPQQPNQPVQQVVVVAVSAPNLTPVRVFPTRPLIRKINNLASIMIPAAFCSAAPGTPPFANNEVREVPVPDFDWGVASDSGAAINTPFSVAVINGASNTTLTTQQVPSIPRSDTRTFRNWPGRPTRIRVVKVTGPPLVSEYQNTTGCYLLNASASSVTLDPKPLIIRVDSATPSQIAESRENDNDLPIQ